MRTLQSCARGDNPDESTYVDVDSREERNMGQEEDEEDGEIKEERSVEKRAEEDDVEDEEDDDVSLLLFGVPCVAEDESHYITTHEIQLTELSDHEGDNDVSVGWEDNQVFSFVDYDAFEQNGSKDVNEKQSNPHVSSSQSQPQQQIHLSIRTTSRAGGDNLVYHGDVSGYLFRGVDGDAAKCFIAAPGRVHFGAKLRGREVTDSSGTSSAVSELDDADKEVRNLTAKAFKSLAYPYFDTINFSTSSESSASEKWSFVDLKYGNVDKGVLSRQSLENRSFTGFTLNGNPQTQLGFMGKLGQGHSGVIRLTETLNFRCNVGVAGAERPPMFAQSATAAGSRSKDEVTNAVAGSRQWRLGAATKPPCQKTMEHKKAIFASSLIKNVISKKMQFEQERKMERGEISEPNTQEDTKASKGGRELVRQSSKFSESSSDLAIMCVDELGDLVDSGSCDTKSDRTHRQASVALETNLEHANEAGIDTKKGALEASKSTLLHSQNSAFRCWKDDELEFQKDRKSVRENALEANDSDQSGVKLTKMSSLFLPNIQQLSSEEQRQNSPVLAHEESVKARPDNALLVPDTKGVTAKSPEIKINLRSGKNEPFGVTRLRAPNIGCNRTEDYKSLTLAAALKGECSDKVPHFMVRDIRDNKGKLQTPIHQVRDVRKLVKSSYHFVSLDNNDNKTTLATSDNQTETKKQTSGRNSTSVSPIVIKCQSVNTNNNGKTADNVNDLCKREDFERSSPEGAKGTQFRTSGKSNSADGLNGSKIESKVAAWKQDKDNLEKKTDKITNQVALEKLQAAVKTMEQLYVFEKNEWKRKSEPNPVTDSHVLPFINEERDKPPAKEPSSEKMESLVRREEQVAHSSSSHDDRFIMKTMKSENQATKSSYGTKTFTPKSPKLPTSRRTTAGRLSGQDRADSKEEEHSNQEQTMSDHENYLTIPVKPVTKQVQPPETSSVYTLKSRTPPGPAQTSVQDNPPTSIVMETPETPTAAIYHSLPLGITTNQLYCFSPAVTPAPSLDHFQPTQRKMLLDPTTGNYYLVETPMQPSSKRLFDPETGQYVDVPLPPAPMTPVPMSPLAISPGAYAHTYMIYPGFMHPTVIPARTLVPSQMSVHSDPPDKTPPQQSEAPYMESPYYMATGKSPQTAPAPANRTSQGYAALKQPFISISSHQQGPRIIAPPSFDGTTMSFVVEHR
ncbi:uncharacterized protein C4orf54 homolog [Boleophthalmus pectinirostris]|uniref:uncharacterized protein C4orf54 homolog n=1 Tax=Boleophthalmus pectinirostris TaxID=150288 RepID=UPI00242E1592|nr:uncharacterized protein C4orf54 homolog [Boleophthalmus pectinirostris]